MAIRLAVNYENTAHRFVSTAQVTLTLTGPPETEAKGSQAGHRLWDISSVSLGNTFVLRILIPEPPGSGLGKPLLDLKQLLEVIALPKGGESLTPKTTSSDPCKDRFNPRLTGQLVGAGVGRRFEINVDLTFLDVTDYYEAKTKRLDEYTNMPQTNPVVQKVGLRPPDPPPHYDARLRILEFTGGRPVSWAVLIPPAVKADSNRIGATLFFRPALPVSYTNTDDLGIHEMIRYLGDPTPEDTPYFSQPPPKTWITFPQCGWEKQVSQAGKCALFVHPFPHGGDFGAVVPPRFPELLASLVKILWADGTIATSVCSDVRLARIAVGGFSFGGGATFQCLASRPEKIDELYLFDPNGAGANKNAIEAWFKRGGKKLRMFGGANQFLTMLAIAKDLASTDATVQPSIRAGWDAFSSIYPVAVHCLTPPRSPQFASPTDPSPGVLSTLTQMFVDGKNGDGGLNMEGHLASGTVVKDVINDVIAEEAAIVALSLVNAQNSGTKLTKPKKLPDGKTVPAGTIQTATTPPTFITPDKQLIFPVTKLADFQQNLRIIANNTKHIRHQWSVIGGIDSNLDTNRGKNFFGYLQLAIGGSGFP